MKPNLRSNLIKKTLILCLSLIIAAFGLALTAFADGPAPGVTINAERVELYAVNSGYESAEGSTLPAIPEDKKSFQLEVRGAQITSCYVTSGESVTVEYSGVAEPPVPMK